MDKQTDGLTQTRKDKNAKKKHKKLLKKKKKNNFRFGHGKEKVSLQKRLKKTNVIFVQYIT